MKHRLSYKDKMTIQFWLGVFVILTGLVLLFLGFYAVPLGIIHPSVLTAFGEAATFSGALIGIDYSYKFKIFQREMDERHRNNVNDEEIE